MSELQLQNRRPTPPTPEEITKAIRLEDIENPVAIPSESVEEAPKPTAVEQAYVAKTMAETKAIQREGQTPLFSFPQGAAPTEFIPSPSTAYSPVAQPTGKSADSYLTHAAGVLARTPNFAFGMNETDISTTESNANIILNDLEAVESIQPNFNPEKWAEELILPEWSEVSDPSGFFNMIEEGKFGNALRTRYENLKSRTRSDINSADDEKPEKFELDDDYSLADGTKADRAKARFESGTSLKRTDAQRVYDENQKLRSELAVATTKTENLKMKTAIENARSTVKQLRTGYRTKGKKRIAIIEGTETGEI